MDAFVSPQRAKELQWCWARVRREIHRMLGDYDWLTRAEKNNKEIKLSVRPITRSCDGSVQAKKQVETIGAAVEREKKKQVWRDVSTEQGCCFAWRFVHCMCEIEKDEGRRERDETEGGKTHSTTSRWSWMKLAGMACWLARSEQQYIVVCVCVARARWKWRHSL